MNDDDTTSFLLGKLKNSPSVDDFLNKFDTKLGTVDFKTYVNRIAWEKSCSIREICVRTSMNESYCYQLFNGIRKPSRDKILQLCFGIKLNLTESNKLLKSGGKSELYCKDKRDAVIIFGLNNSLSIIDVETVLEQRGLEPIIRSE